MIRPSLLAAAALCVSGCTLLVRSPYPTHPVTAAPERMRRNEAIDLGLRHCAARGYACRLDEAELDDKRKWELKFKVPGRGKVKFEFDAWSRELIKVEEKFKRHRRHDDDDDDDHDD